MQTGIRTLYVALAIKIGATIFSLVTYQRSKERRSEHREREEVREEERNQQRNEGIRRRFPRREFQKSPNKLRKKPNTIRKPIESSPIATRTRSKTK